MKAMHPLNRLRMLCIRLEIVRDMNPLDHQNFVFFFYFTNDIGYEDALTCRYLTRFQRASKGSSQSATCSGNDVVKGCGVWRMDICINTIMLCHS